MGALPHLYSIRAIASALPPLRLTASTRAGTFSTSMALWLTACAMRLHALRSRQLAAFSLTNCNTLRMIIHYRAWCLGLKAGGGADIDFTWEVRQ